ncbi:hypothetical protein C8F04DRAFT_1236406 [Mycena alexandri]|uniref:Uncharacterized protein n=1 Tax=Mycena alexandri TaxID=1745969 RepID=A0AAD6WZY1_9AGAR|nr:hypothetical protein C8F04DRAFT_1236406 [Mycena alexandri]
MDTTYLRPGPEVYEYQHNVSKDLPALLATIDWQMGLHSGSEYWSRTEKFIAQRRSGAIDGNMSLFKNEKLQRRNRNRSLNIIYRPQLPSLAHYRPTELFFSKEKFTLLVSAFTDV